MKPLRWQITPKLTLTYGVRNTYDGLPTRLVGRYNGYTMNFTYTFSKALGYGINPSINIPDYFRLNRSEQSNSLRHVFSASIVAELPFGKTQRWAKSGVPAAIAWTCPQF